ncbi:hypothetical protein HPB50_007200 [Hyalomma asiaticum]|uniref:Uncharacterized protein n=1 Tax=Hyalomma asiaticum TaxID=266040 RepID=A0ACB7TGD7_HYAAI|nr:hypothetical protein HPB50_007200 [Hyalomma asiaticum]
MDPSTGAIPKRPRKRKVKAKLTFGSTSTGNNGLPCYLQANFSDLIGLLETSQRDEADEDWSDVTVSTTEVAGPSRATTTGVNNEAESFHGSKTSAKNRGVATSKLVHHPSSFGRDDQVPTVETPEPKGLTEADVADIVRHMRQLLLDKGPSQERELMEAVSPLHAEQVQEIHGSMTAFLNERPGFVVVNEDLYTFVYYDPDGEVQGDSASRTKDEAIAGPSTASKNSDDQDTAVCDGGPHRECAASSSIRPANEFTIEGEHEEREEHGLEDSSIQVTSTPRSQAAPRRKKKSKAKCQNRLSRITEAKSTKQAHHSDVMQLQKQETQKSTTYEVHQQRVKVGELPHALPQQSRQSAVTQKKSPAPKILKPTDGKATVAKVNPQPPLPQPRPRRRRKRNQRPRPKTTPPSKNKRGTPPASTIPQPLAEADERSSRSPELAPPDAKPVKPPCSRKQAEAAYSDTPSVLPTEEEAPKKNQLEEKLSRIARMVKNRRPDIAEKEIGKKIEQLRKSRGGLSGMTYNDIVELVIVEFEADAKEMEKSEDPSVDKELLP